MSAPGRNAGSSAAGAARTPAPGPEMQALVDEYRSEVSLRCRSPAAKTASRSAQIVIKALWRQGISRPQDISRPVIKQYLARLAADGLSPKTLRNHHTAISTFCEYLSDLHLLPENPCRGIRLARPDRRFEEYLHPDEVLRALRTAREAGIWTEVCLALSTGLRLGEMIRLQWGDIDFDRRQLLVRESKSGRSRAVPLSSAAIKALSMQYEMTGIYAYVFPARKTWPGGWRYVDKPRHSSCWLRAFRPLQEAIPKFRRGRGAGRAWHLLRHTFASRAAQTGVPLRMLQQWMGHSDIRMTERYSHLAPGFDEEIEAVAPPIGADATAGTRRLFPELDENGQE